MIHKNIYNGFLNLFPFKKKPDDNGLSQNIIKSDEYFDEQKIRELEIVFKIKINNFKYFEEALTHRSYLQITEKADSISNERLEFLGDAVLGLIIADYLFLLNQNEAEGELTKKRSWLVNKKSLAICARKLELDKFILLSFSAEKSLKTGSDSILADALEALIAAIYLDSGMDAARKFVIDYLLPIMMQKRLMIDRNYKSILLESMQAEGKPSPNYHVLSEEGPDHDKVFNVGVFLDKTLLGTGAGKSKKEAEQIAARNALERKNFLNKT